MKEKVILPFVDNPYATMYHNLVFPMGIIQGNAKEDIIPWVCGRFINCNYSPASQTQFDICFTDKWATEDNILIQRRIDLLPELYRHLSWDCLELLRRILDMGCYIYGNYNEEFIAGKSSYQKSYYFHDYLLIGYDDVNKVFHSVGYLADRRFQRYDIPYDNMKSALETLKAAKITFNIFKYNTEAVFPFDLNRIIHELYHYIHSMTWHKQYQKDQYFGMEAIRQLIWYFKNRVEDGNTIDDRYTKGLLEHKYFMKLRVEYLLKNGYISDESLLQNSERTCRLAQIVHMLGLKYTVTKKQEAAANIYNMINQILQTEIEYLPLLQDSLQSFKDRRREYGK